MISFLIVLALNIALAVYTWVERIKSIQNLKYSHLYLFLYLIGCVASSAVGSLTKMPLIYPIFAIVAGFTLMSIPNQHAAIKVFNSSEKE